MYYDILLSFWLWLDIRFILYSMVTYTIWGEKVTNKTVHKMRVLFIVLLVQSTSMETLQSQLNELTEF